MLSSLKKDGARSSAGETKRGDRGRLEIYADKNPDGTFTIHFNDYGNYGKVRWSADFAPLTPDDLDAVICDLMDLANGATNSTRWEGVNKDMVDGHKVDTQTAEEAQAEAEEVAIAEILAPDPLPNQ